MTTKTQPEQPKAGTLSYTELASSDPEATRRFLEKVFGWKFESFPMGDGRYHAFETPGGRRGGVRGVAPKEPPSVTNFVEVAQLDAAQKQVQKAGGKVTMPRTEVPGMGAFFAFQLPGGPELACWEAGPKPS